jgi:hypothetical protein
MTRMLITSLALTGALLTLPNASRPLWARQGATPDQHVAALKQSLQESQKRLRQYEWIETTVLTLKGEEKSRKQQRCYYGAEGTLQKVPVGDAPPQDQGGGGRRGGRLKQKIVENKKSEMQDYMERAANLVKVYVPPSPAQIQSAKDAGKMAIRPLAQGRVRLEFNDYLQAGDRLGIDVDTAANRLLGLNVATYLEKPEDAVTLSVRMGMLADGTGFTEETTFDAVAKNIRVVIQNSGYRPLVR